MRLKNIVTAFITAVTIASFGTISAFAEEAHPIQGTIQGTNEAISQESSENIDVYTEDLSRGKNFPSKNDVYDFNEHYAYEGYIESWSYSIYTNYWFTGANTMTLKIYGSSIYDYFTNTNPNVERAITVQIYEQGNTITPIYTSRISSWDEYIYKGYYFTFSGLNSNKKYAFQLVKTADGETLSDIDLTIY